jgi:hypothetical protein
MKLAIATIVSALCFTAYCAPAQAALGFCTPAPDCTAAGKPCDNAITHTQTEELGLSPVAGASVIRVKLCTGSDSVCGNANSGQVVSVFAYSGNTLVGTWVLNSFSTNGIVDTGPYTKLPPLTRLAVRCNNSGVSNLCRIAWQHCRETLPIQGSAH